jgi:NADH-quinone oxidoreductase subunit L
MPVTFWTFLVASLAIAGIVPLSGFFSKDEILWGAFSSGHRGIWGVLLVGAGVTAFYMFRLVYLVFYGEARGSKDVHAHAHESPRSMTIPLATLAVLSVVGGWIGIPKALTGGADLNAFSHWLTPAIAHGEGHGEHGTTLELGLMAVALGGSLLGIALAHFMYRKRVGMAERLAASFGPLYRLVRNLYWVDELYELLVLRPFYALCRYARTFDVWIVDGTVNGVRHVTVVLSYVSYTFDQWVVDGLVNSTGETVRKTSRLLRRLQTGLVQSYAAAMVFGVFVLMVLYSLAR